MEDEDRRQAVRVEPDLLAVLRGADGSEQEGAVRNLSLLGCHVRGIDGPPEGSDHEVEIRPSAGARILLRGRVVRSGEDGVALSFQGVTGDSLVRLRHLLFLHAPEPERIGPELVRRRAS